MDNISSIGPVSHELSSVERKVQQTKESGKEVWVHFGLSANPWHLGHHSYVLQVISRIVPDLLRIVPAKLNPFKGGVAQGTPEVKKELMEAAVLQLKENCNCCCPIELDTQELDSTSEFSYTSKTIANVWKNAQESNAEIFLLLTTETVRDFHLWTNPLSIVERATLIYGKREEEEEFDKTKFINTLLAIDRVARSLGMMDENYREVIIEAAPNDEIPLEVENGIGIREEVKVVFKKVRPIAPEVIEALDQGYISVTGKIKISSTEIRSSIIAGSPIDQLVGPRVAEVISRHQLYAAS